MPVLKTTRLNICELTSDDAPFIFELLNTPSWIKFIGDRGIKTLTDAANYIVNGPMKSYAKNNFGLYTVKLKDGNIPIGLCGLIKRDSLEDIDIGFAFLPDYEGKGFAFESCAAILENAKTQFAISRVVAITVKENSRSIQLLEKIGFVFEKFIQLPNDPEELMLFGIQL